MKTLYTILFVWLYFSAAAQVGINNIGAPPHASAMLDISSTNRGLLVPRMTMAQRNAIISPATGLMVYQTDNSPGYYYNSGTPSSTVWTLLGGTVAWLTNGSHVYYNSGNVGIGTNAPTALLHAIGTGTGQGNILFAGTYKTSPGNPPASGAGTRMMWYPDKAALRAGVISGTQWDKDSIGDYSVAFGKSSIAKGYSSTASGYETTASGPSSTAFGRITIASGYASTALGYSTKAIGDYAVSAGYATTASGNNSTSIGLNTTASGSTATAMGSNTTASGYRSTSMGSGTIASDAYTTAMGYNTSASGGTSTAMGYETGASNSFATSMGYKTSASGDGSTAMGKSTSASGYGSTSMGVSTSASSYASLAIGRYNIGSGSTNVWTTTDPVFEVGIGSSEVNKSNAFTILKNGRTGIGTNIPQAGLHIKGIGFPGSFLYIQSDAGNDAGIRLYEGVTVKWHVFNDQALAGLMIYNNSGNVALFAKQSNAYVGIGATDPTQKLDVNGNVRIRSMGTGTVVAAVYLTSDGTLITGASDTRLKTHIQPLQNSLDKIMQLQGVSYFWKNDPQMGQRIGFVAQDFEKVLPELSFTNPTDGYKGINYAEVTAVLVEAMKELKKENDNLRARLEKLESEKE